MFLFTKKFGDFFFLSFFGLFFCANYRQSLVLGERRNSNQDKNSQDRFLGLETLYKVGINILTDLWVVMGGPHSLGCKLPTP